MPTRKARDEDDDILEVISGAWQESNTDQRKRPVWMRDEKRPPKAEDLQRKAQMEREDHSIRLGRIGEINDILGIEKSAHFVRDYRAVKTGEVEPWFMSSIRDEHDRLCSFMCQMDCLWQAPYTDMTDRDEAMAKQAFAVALLDDIRKAHRAQGNGPFEWALPDTIRHDLLAAPRGEDHVGRRVAHRIR